MPLINGVKMACEPCIRGHRSTKCNHANERLMVPVRKPGRPLSLCPHPAAETCGCESIMAAIPRRQACHCGGSSGVQAPLEVQPLSSRALQESTELPSPTRPGFRIQKNPRPDTTRRQSFDPANLERMDINSVNIRPVEFRKPTFTGYSTPTIHEMYRILKPIPLATSSQIPPLMSPGIIGGSSHIAGMNGYSNGIALNGLDSITETYTVVNGMNLPHGDAYSVDHGRTLNNGYAASIGYPADNGHILNNGHSLYNGSSLSNGHPRSNGNSFHNGQSLNGSVPNNGPNGLSSCCGGKSQEPQVELKATIIGESSPKGSKEPSISKIPAAGKSCCAPKIISHSQSSSTSSILEGSTSVKRESVSSASTPASMTSQISTPMIPPSMDFANNYQQYSQPETFIYPSTYGSYANPLQPNVWRQSFMTNNYGIGQVSQEGLTSFNGTAIPESLNTTHNCCCGDTCQCIGCAAHPYNDATQDYVRSAWATVNAEQPVEMYSQSSPNGTVIPQPQNGDIVSSPTANTPNSTTSGEEQSFPASDYFFVSYPFSGDGCGGDTQSCPCGDDCECLGCTIHRQPSIPCAGDADTCLCGDGCECIGCSVHVVR